MYRLALVAVAALFAAAAPALAQDRPARPDRQDGTRHPRSHDGYDRRTDGGGYTRRGGSDRGYSSRGYSYGGYAHRGYAHGGYPRYAFPRRYYSYVYPAPLFGYYGPAPYYEAPFYGPVPLPPAYVERYPLYEEDDEEDFAPPPVREYRDRPLAQAEPARPAPRQLAAPAFDRVTLSATELFGFDQSTLRAPQPRLDEIARALVDNPNIGAVTITGYTDRLGSDAYNLQLSQRRADAVKRYLASKGVAADRLKAVGRGKADPVVQCDDKDRAALIRCLEPNRRVEVERITIERRVAPQPR